MDACAASGRSREYLAELREVFLKIFCNKTAKEIGAATKAKRWGRPDVRSPNAAVCSRTDGMGCVARTLEDMMPNTANKCLLALI
jgi:hypothetical protein